MKLPNRLRCLALATLIPVIPVFAAQAPAPAAVSLSATPAFEGLTFTNPVGVVTPPGETTRLFVIEKAGRIAVIPNLAQPTREVFLDISDRVGNAGGEMGLLALAFHPNYRTNREFFVWYTSTTGGAREDRLARFRASADNPNRADPGSEQILIAQLDEAANHNGGQVVFGPDGYLYVSVGDEGAANDRYNNSQRIDYDFFAGILRLDVDRKPGSLRPNPHPAVREGTYAVPPDNPFVGATTFLGATLDPAKVRTETWATGLRNVWRMSFDPQTGDLWAADVGQNAFEEINIIVKGGNYGWAYLEARQAGPRPGAPGNAGFIDPVWDYPRTQGVSVTGGVVVRGARHPLDGNYVFADYASGRVWALLPNGRDRVAPDRVREVAQVAAPTSFGFDPSNGDLLVTSLSQGVLRLKPAAP